MVILLIFITQYNTNSILIFLCKVYLNLKTRWSSHQLPKFIALLLSFSNYVNIKFSLKLIRLFIMSMKYLTLQHKYHCQHYVLSINIICIVCNCCDWSYFSQLSCCIISLLQQYYNITIMAYAPPRRWCSCLLIYKSANRCHYEVHEAVVILDSSI